MLHQGIVSPEAHPVNHPPLDFFLLFIRSTLGEISGVLEDISGIVCERMASDTLSCPPKGSDG